MAHNYELSPEQPKPPTPDYRWDGQEKKFVKLSQDEIASRILQRSQAVTETNLTENEAEVVTSPEELFKRVKQGERLPQEERVMVANYIAERNVDQDSPFYGIALIERDLDVLAAELTKYGLQDVPIGWDAAGRGRLVNDMRDRLKYVQACNSQNYDRVRDMIDSGTDEAQIKKWLYESGGYNQLSQVTLPGYTKNMRDYVATAYLNDVRAGFNKYREAAERAAVLERVVAASAEKDEKKKAAYNRYLREINLARQYPQVAAVLGSASNSDLEYLAQSLAAGDVGDTVINPMDMKYRDAVYAAAMAEMDKPEDPEKTLVRNSDDDYDPVQARVRELRALQAATPQRVGKERRKFFINLKN